MPVYKDADGKKWRAVYRIKLRDGSTKQKSKRGFRTKKEAEAYIAEQQKAMKADLGMTLSTFITEKYMPDKKGMLKERTYLTKEHMIRTHLLEAPIAGMSINAVQPEDIIAWQNEILKQGYSECYNRTLNNQIVGIFNHAERYYGLEKSPCRGIAKIGRSDAEKQMLRYWTHEEFLEFLDSISPETDAMYHLLFQLQYYCGFRIGDDDDKIRLNQRKPSKYKGLRRFGPEKNLQRINKFMKERPIFYKNLIQMKENIRFYLRCFYCITKVMILQFNSENRTELARNG